MKQLKFVAVPALAVALLTGCSGPDPVAARVGDETVRTSEVDLLSRVQCELSQAQPDPQTGQAAAPRPMRQLRNESMSALVDVAVFEQLAEEKGAEYDVDAYRQQMEGVKAALAGVAEADRDQVREILSGYWKGRLQLEALGAEELRDQGVANPTDEQRSQAVQQVYTEYRDSLDIELSPAFSPDDRDLAGFGDGSVSVPVSEEARQATSDKPDAAWVADLPRSQRCG